jgi:hypothetical protein
MCHKEVRKLSQALTLRYDKVLFILTRQTMRSVSQAQRSSSATIPTAASRSCMRARPWATSRAFAAHGLGHGSFLQ